MKNTIISRRYANALIDSADNNDILTTIYTNFTEFINIINSNKKLLDILIHPLIKPLEKMDIIKEISQSAQLNIKFINFLCLIIQKERINIINDIHNEFDSLYKKLIGEQNAEVYSAIELQDDSKNRLTEVLKKITGKKMKIKYYTNEKCIGGIKVKIGNKIFDGTIENKLNLLKTIS